MKIRENFIEIGAKNCDFEQKIQDFVEKIQEKFKILVKKFHPDMNSGNKKFEEKLKLITLAYTQLKNTYREKIDT